MRTYCSVIDCLSNFEKRNANETCHQRFKAPEDPELCKKWRESLKLPDHYYPQTKHKLEFVCARHFEETEFVPAEENIHKT